MANLIDLKNGYTDSTSVERKMVFAGEIVSRIGEQLYLFFFSRAPQAAEDLRQYVFVSIFGGIENFRGETESQFLGWCFRIATNTLNEYFRKGGSQRFIPFDPESLKDLLDAGAAEVSDASEPETFAQEAAILLQKSNAECFDLLWIRFVVGLSLEEIAVSRDVTYDAVRMRVSRCREEAELFLRRKVQSHA